MYDVVHEPLITPSCAAAALDWYDRHRRALPWRSEPHEKADPYVVWLSEIMLQQTTVAAVKPYFAAFLARWPNVSLLAQAPIDEVMRQWAGLGYYSRARNLHACAKRVAGEFDGRFPDTEAALRKLPGLGPYTAAAIAAIAFGRRAAVVDGNVERVVARLFAIAAPLPAARALIREKVEALTPSARPGDFAQAMMDLGATICTPKQPACAICPLLDHCAGRASGEPRRFPVKAPKRERPRWRGAAFFVRRADGAILVRTRPPKGLLGGMVEIPGTAWSADFDPGAALREAPIHAPYRKLESVVEHVFTHFALRLDIYVAEIARTSRAPAGCRWALEGDLDKEALPSVMRKVVEAARKGGKLFGGGD
ncbi:A/G-specific adenine glycosylase [Methylocapsa polymorpha]|uniref:Adenine DNA glycosylase n=1 Tax=Methylocapsa polymorpha TaxID=3080828 RepID=A0ABZ0HPW7_9HYPH|nr:A/G-specific adenine glycosylase [Methylocapsa sp. RX1]